MRKFPFTLVEGQIVKGRFGKYVGGTSPAWDVWRDYEVTYVQKDKKGNDVIYAINGIEMCPYNYEGVLDYKDTVHCVIIEDIYFEFEL